MAKKEKEEAKAQRKREKSVVKLQKELAQLEKRRTSLAVPIGEQLGDPSTSPPNCALSFSSTTAVTPGAQSLHLALPQKSKTMGSNLSASSTLTTTTTAAPTSSSPPPANATTTMMISTSNNETHVTPAAKSPSDPELHTPSAPALTPRSVWRVASPSVSGTAPNLISLLPSTSPLISQLVTVPDSSFSTPHSQQHQQQQRPSEAPLHSYDSLATTTLRVPSSTTHSLATSNITTSPHTNANCADTET